MPRKLTRSFMQKSVGVTAEETLQQMTVSVAGGYAGREEREILGTLSKMVWRVPDGFQRFD